METSEQEHPTLEQLGWDRYVQAVGMPDGLPLEHVFRVTTEHRDRYELSGAHGPMVGIVRAGARYRADEDIRPKVGDWVRAEPMVADTKLMVTQVLPRLSKLSRIGIGKEMEEQIIAANVDLLFVVQGLDAGVKPRQLERYLTMAAQGGVAAVVVLSKEDVTMGKTAGAEDEALQVSAGAPVIVVSAKTGTGFAELRTFCQGRTVALVGPSGSGKSSIINRLQGDTKQATGEVRGYDSRGRHTTTRRELSVLEGGGVLIDTPGLREIQLPSYAEALDTSFSDIAELAIGCKFNDCDHEKSEGCEVLKALHDGSLDKGRYEGFVKLRREQLRSGAKSKKPVHFDRQLRYQKTTKEFHKKSIRGTW